MTLNRNSFVDDDDDDENIYVLLEVLKIFLYLAIICKSWILLMNVFFSLWMSNNDILYIQHWKIYFKIRERNIYRDRNIYREKEMYKR